MRPTNTMSDEEIALKKERIMKELKQYGIHNEAELDQAMKNAGKLDISIFAGKINTTIQMG